MPGIPKHVGVILAAIIVIAAGLLLRMESDRRQGLYWYDVSADYQFSFDEGEVERFPVRVTQEGVQIPRWSRDRPVGVLRMSLRSDWRGAWLEPAIELFVGEELLCRQVFERGAAGVRYLSLCGAEERLTEGDVLGLRGRHLTWNDQEAEFLQFGAPDLDGARVLVLAPHPDDAEIAAFGLYSGAESWVVTVTTGAYGGDVFKDLPTRPSQRSDLQAWVRVWDSLVVPRLGGVPPDRALNLGYFTLSLEAMRRTPDAVVPDPFGGSAEIAEWRSRNHSRLLASRPSVSSWENLVGDLAHLLELIEPGIVVAPHPVLDRSTDHVLTTAALLEALETLGDPPVTLLLYSVHHPLSDYFPGGSAGDGVPLPPWFDGSVRFRSVYAHALDHQTQLKKLFALKAMHDLRGPPEWIEGSPSTRVFRSLHRALGEVLRDPARELSFFRRAVRANELFFVYHSEDRLLLQDLLDWPSHGTP